MNSAPLPAEPALCCDVRVYFYDTDAGSVVHNIAYLRFIEEARSRLAEHLGWPLAAMSGDRPVPVVTRTEIRYLKPARLGDRLAVHATLDALRAASFDCSFRIERGEPSQLLATCRQTLACVDLRSGRPTRLRSDWLERWPHLCGPRPAAAASRGSIA